MDKYGKFLHKDYKSFDSSSGLQIPNRWLIFILVLLCLITACNPKNRIGYTRENGKLVKTLYNSRGNIFFKKSYSIDTFHSDVNVSFRLDTIPSGAEMHYYPNEKLKKWLWYRRNENSPTAGIHFDINSNEKEIGGVPFIGEDLTKDKKITIEIINPPNVKYEIYFVDTNLTTHSYKTTLLKPIYTDTTIWVVINDSIYQNNHIYSLVYYLMNKQNKIVDSSIVDLVEAKSDNEKTGLICD